ncbi:ferritin-like domain-containing protein [Emticicia sp. 17c]|uniref:ferritin-like domain-containing protein n=1 Tax=Emticicia sp. 17c TaxID=3127704 RepID=UPI00301DB738
MKNYTTKISRNNGDKLKKLFTDGLKDMYWAEKRLVKALPKLARAAVSEDLQVVFEIHLTETQEHVNRLKKIFELINEPAKIKRCPAMMGLLEECDTIIKSTEESSIVRDCGLIFVSQKIEHYEIASYGTLRTIANIMNYREVAELLQMTLEEERVASSKLADLADSYIMEVVMD